MPFLGQIKSWNDERGFGFIESSQGGQDIFVHVKALRPGFGKPRIDDVVTFDVELNAEGKKRAKNVEKYRAARIRMQPRINWATRDLLAILGFAVIFGLIEIKWHVPQWIALLYLGTSLISIIVYAPDKAAAIAKRWRVSEQTLLLLGLVGGWPGAIVAQQVFRHKSNKPSFRSTFWPSVVVNIVAFIVITTPILSNNLINP